MGAEPAALPTEKLDELLTLQLTIAWAGEALTDPPHLPWWRTAMHDEFQGGDLLARVLPRTHAWAALEAVRLAARRTEAAHRAQFSDPDLLLSLFHLGHAVDEQLDDRLATHKRHAAPPRDTLPLPFDLAAPLDRGALTSWLSALAAPPAIEATPVGRRLRGEPATDATAAARTLAAALAPLADTYPTPHYRLGR